jgi:ERCC4-related helicase
MTSEINSGNWSWSESLGRPVRVIETRTLWDVTTALVKDDGGKVHELINSDLKPLTKERGDRVDRNKIIHIAAGARLDHHLHLPETLSAQINQTIVPLPHQLQHLYDALTRDSTRLLLADEVGLGKTITAGLILSELRNRGQANRILVLSPAGLVAQWIQEMRDHFHMEFSPLFTKLMLTPESGRVWTQFDLVIASYDSIKPIANRHGWTKEETEAYNDNRFYAMLDAGWDVVIIDEAHRMAGGSVGVARNALAAGVSAVAPHLLLLTGTPHQGKADQFHRLVQFLDPDAFSTPDTVTRESLRPYLLRTLKKDAVTMEGSPLFVEKTVHLAVLPDDLQTNLHKGLYAETADYIRKGYAEAENSRRLGIGFLMVLVQRRQASSTAALEETLRKRLAFLERIAAPGDTANCIGYGLSFPFMTEDAASGSVQDVSDEWSVDQDSDIHEESLKAPSFDPSQEIEWIRRLLDLVERLKAEGPDPKACYLLELLRRLQQIERDPKAKFLIFTEFYGTQNMLKEYLEQHGYAVGILNGSMNLYERQEALQSFRHHSQILVSTEAGGEGLNLQFAHLVINYDLPWNPMRIEQRIGRVHRIGQQHPVTVYNLLLNDTVEHRVVEILSEKLNNILSHLGIDKLSDVLDTTAIDSDLQRIYREALMLDKRQLETEIDSLLNGIRTQILDAKKAKELVAEPLNLERIRERLAQPVSYWVEAFASHASPDLKPDLQDEMTRKALGDLNQWVRGEPVPVLKVSDVPATVNGIWSLWRAGIQDSRGRRYVRYCPLLETVQGDLLIPSAMKLWDRLIEGAFEVESLKDETSSSELFQQACSTASGHLRETYTGIVDMQQVGLKDDLDRHKRSLSARRATIASLGLPEVKRHRYKKLDDEDRRWRDEHKKRQIFYPILEPILVAMVEGVPKV